MLMLSANVLGDEPRAVKASSQLTVTSAFINVYEGASYRYPVFTIMERGETFEVLFTQFQWLRVILPDKRLGWVHSQVAQKNAVDGEGRIANVAGNFKRVLDSSWSLSTYFGRLDGIPSISLALEKSINSYFAIDVQASRLSSDVLYGTDIKLGVLLFPTTYLAPLYPFVQANVGWLNLDANNDGVYSLSENTYGGGGGLAVKLSKTNPILIKGMYSINAVTNGYDPIGQWSIGITIQL